MKFIVDSRKLHEEVDVTPIGFFYFSRPNPDPNKKWKAFFGRKTRNKFPVCIIKHAK